MEVPVNTRLRIALGVAIIMGLIAALGIYDFIEKNAAPVTVPPPQPKELWALITLSGEIRDPRGFDYGQKVMATTILNLNELEKSTDRINYKCHLKGFGVLNYGVYIHKFLGKFEFDIHRQDKTATLGNMGINQYTSFRGALVVQEKGTNVGHVGVSMNRLKDYGYLSIFTSRDLQELNERLKENGITNTNNELNWDCQLNRG